MRFMLVVAAAAAFLSGAANAEKRVIGNFLVGKESDPFEKTERHYALMVGSGKYGLGIRCFDSKASALLIAPRPHNQKSIVLLKYRAGKGDIANMAGVVVGPKSILIGKVDILIDDAKKHNQIAFRVPIGGRNEVSVVFKPKRAARALAGVEKGCATDIANRRELRKEK